MQTALWACDCLYAAWIGFAWLIARKIGQLIDDSGSAIAHEPLLVRYARVVEVTNSQHASAFMNSKGLVGLSTAIAGFQLEKKVS